MPSQQFSPEVYELFIQEMDRPTQAAFAGASHQFWQLARPFIFTTITIPHRRGCQRIVRRVERLQELLKDEQNAVLHFVKHFEVKFIDPPSYPEHEYPTPEEAQPIAEVVKLLETAPNLKAVAVGIEVGKRDDGKSQKLGHLPWSNLPPDLEVALRHLIQRANIAQLSLTGMLGLPFNLFREFHGTKLDITRCTQNPLWFPVPIQEALKLEQLVNDSEYPFLTIYSKNGDVERDQMVTHPNTSYSALSTLWHRVDLDWPHRVLKVIEAASPSLSDLRLMANADIFSISSSNLPRLDLAQLHRLRSFRLDYDCQHDPVTSNGISILCDTFLRPSALTPSALKEFTLAVVVRWTERDLYAFASQAKNHWQAVDDTLSQKCWEGVQIRLEITCAIDGGPGVDEREEGYRDLGKHVANLFSTVLPNLSTSHSVVVNLKLASDGNYDEGTLVV